MRRANLEANRYVLSPDERPFLKGYLLACPQGWGLSGKVRGVYYHKPTVGHANNPVAHLGVVPLHYAALHRLCSLCSLGPRPDMPPGGHKAKEKKAPWRVRHAHVVR